MVSDDQYNSGAVDPFLGKLGLSLSDPIKEKVDRFDFDFAREESFALAVSLGIETGEQQAWANGTPLLQKGTPEKCRPEPENSGGKYGTQ